MGGEVNQDDAVVHHNTDEDDDSDEHIGIQQGIAREKQSKQRTDGCQRNGEHEHDGGSHGFEYRREYHVNDDERCNNQEAEVVGILFLVYNLDCHAGRDVGCLDEFVHLQTSSLQDALGLVDFGIEPVIYGDFIVLVYAVDIALSPAQIDLAETAEVGDGIVVVADFQVAEVFQGTHLLFVFLLFFFSQFFVFDNDVVFLVAGFIGDGGDILGGKVV